MTPTAKQMLDIERKFLNTSSYLCNNQFNTWYYGHAVSGNNYAWCMVFQQYCFRKEAKWTLPTVTANVGISWSGYTKTNKGNMKPGDLVIFDWENDNCRDHIGMFEEWITPGVTFNCLEGNTAISGNYSYMKRRTRNVSSVHGYWRPPYEAEAPAPTPTPTPSPVKEIYKVVVSDGPLNIRAGAGTNYAVVGSLSNGTEISICEENGSWIKLTNGKGWVWRSYTTKVGNYTKTDFIKEVQSILHVTVDGVAGNQTLGATVTVSKNYNSRHAVVKAIQKRLNSLGYDCGVADGVAGVKFDSAIKAYQKANGCVPDGEVTRCNKTWKKLLGMA